MAAIEQSTRTHRSAALERANHDDCSRRPGPQPPAHRKLADAGDALKLDDTEDAVVGFRTETPNPRTNRSLHPSPNYSIRARSAQRRSTPRPLRTKDRTRPEGAIQLLERYEPTWQRGRSLRLTLRHRSLVVAPSPNQDCFIVQRRTLA
jgi:hypothetical protein